MHNRTMKRLICALLVAIMAFACSAPAALASVPAKVSSSSARAYKSASTDSASLKLPKNLKLSITAVAGGWAKVKYKGKAAYVRLDKLSPTKKAKRYASDDANVYDSSGDKIGSVSKGATVYLLGTIGGHYCVASSSGSVGFMKSGTLSKKKPAAPKLSKVDKVLIVAKSLLGTKYALSDNPPNSFNCSSFVQYCMGKAGISMKGTAADQAADSRYKLIKSISDLKKGDVLFFAEGKTIDHSAIYIGDGEFVEASANAGKVQTNTLTDWYRSHFICARRP